MFGLGNGMRILYLDLDTLRADHLGCYGYHRDTSPNIDWIASEGVRFDGCHCSDAPCLPSRSALMSGRFGIHTGAVGHGGTSAEFRHEGPSRSFRDMHSHACLPNVYKRAGLNTVYIGGFGERHSLWEYYAGFREIHDTGKGGMESAEDVTPTAMSWIKEHAREDNWYLHVNYWDPHTPYRAPAEFGNPFAKDPLPAWLEQPGAFEKTANAAGPHTALEINMYDDQESPRYPRHPGKVVDRAGLRRLIDGYDCGIRYMDTHIGQLLDAFRAAGVLDDLCIIVSADHGENFGELDIYAEHATADRATCNIPLILRWKGGRKGASDPGLVYNLDLTPTMAELLDVPPHPSWDGRSFAPSVLGDVPAGRDYLVLSQGCHVCQRSVLWDQWLYLRTYHDGFHLFPREMLFNLQDDPHEQVNVADRHPEVCDRAARLLMDWHDDMMATQPPGFYHDPLRLVIHEGGPMHAPLSVLPKYCQRLEATGRGPAAQALRGKYPSAFPKG